MRNWFQLKKGILMSKNTNYRLELLQNVGKLISEKRNQEYGEPYQNLDRTVKLLHAYLGERKGVDLEPEDVAVIGILLKIGRLAHDTSKIDSWEDVAGYAAIGCEVMRIRTEEQGECESQTSVSLHV